MPRIEGILEDDDIIVGDWIALIGYKEDEEEAPSFMYNDDPQHHTLKALKGMKRRDPDGRPFKVVAIDAPFILAEDYDGDPASFDMRYEQFKKLSETYVNAAREMIERAKELRKQRDEEIAKKIAAKIGNAVSDSGFQGGKGFVALEITKDGEVREMARGSSKD